MNCRNEIQRVQEESRPAAFQSDEGLIAVEFESDGDAEIVVSRAKEVMRAVLAPGFWSDSSAQTTALPSWFVNACAPEQAEEDIEASEAAWRAMSLADKREAARTKRWRLSGWLYWLHPENRTWCWWSHSAAGDSGRVLVQVDSYPTVTGALEWLLRAAGAVETDVSFEIA